MNKIFALTLAMAFAGTAHAQTPAHSKSAASVVNKASVATQNTQSHTSIATGAPAKGNAAASQRGLLKCVPPNAAKTADTASTACRPTKTVQL
jgi:hypothetical protein